MSDVLKKCKLKTDKCFNCDENHLCHALQSMTAGRKCSFFKTFEEVLNDYVIIYKDYDVSEIRKILNILDDYNKTKDLRKELQYEISDL